MRPCDVHAKYHQEKIYLQNGDFADSYYQRMSEKVKVVLMECGEGWDTCVLFQHGDESDRRLCCCRTGGSRNAANTSKG